MLLSLATKPGLGPQAARKTLVSNHSKRASSSPRFPCLRSPTRRHPHPDGSSLSHVTQAVVIPNEYGLVLGSVRPVPCESRQSHTHSPARPPARLQVSVTCIVLYWMSFQVAFARKKFNVQYPRLYAEGDSEDAQRFNCVQRGHQNSLELAPQAFVCQLLMGLKFPIAAAVLGVAWAIGRIIYFKGYATGEPSGRIQGGIVAGLVWIALVLGTGYAGFSMYFL